ncbi:SEM5A-like protein [Mya arenaria]|uniref:SEM5A-like protein n=1 Tax=Mya arenaria TaxID=6604 RepID=A0ABY7EQB0_MYAAR|nr:SEM5A-like protein [Mya arenaria]
MKQRRKLQHTVIHPGTDKATHKDQTKYYAVLLMPLESKPLRHTRQQTTSTINYILFLFRLDGGWSAWSEYSNCSSTCGSGHRTRVRTCTDPAPEGGGHVCVGPSLDRALCDNGPCPDSKSVSLFTVLRNYFDFKGNVINEQTHVQSIGRHSYSPRQTHVQTMTSTYIHICDSKLVQYAIQTQQAILPLQKPPCSNMEFISQQMMLVDLCSAPSDYSNWVLGEDVKMATEQCDIGVLEVTVNLAHVDNNIYTVTW